MFKWPGSLPKSSSLSLYRDLKSNYQPDQPIDDSWEIISHSFSVGQRFNETNFAKAASIISKYSLSPTNDFSSTLLTDQKSGLASLGDIVLHHFHLPVNLLQITTTSRITGLVIESKRRGITLISTENHIFIGEWSIVVTLTNLGDVQVLIHGLQKENSLNPLLIKPLLPHTTKLWLDALQSSFNTVVTE